AFSIPMCVGSIRCMRKAKNKSDIIGWGVLSLIFVSFIGGLLMLVTRDDHFSSTKGFVTADSVNLNKKETAAIKAANHRQDKLNKAVNIGLERLANTTTSAITEKDKVEIKNKLLGIKKRIPECKDDQTMYLLEYEIGDALKPLSKRRNMKILIGVAATAVAAIAITISIVIPVNINKERKWDEEYKELESLVYNYSPSSESRISELLWDLRGHRDTTILETEYKNGRNYYYLLNLIGNYEGSTTMDSIKTRLSSIDAGYKKKDTIKNECDKIEPQTKRISFTLGDSSDNYCTNEKAEANRSAIMNICDENKSGLWNFTTYFNKIGSPDLICGTKCVCNNYYFKFYKENSSYRLEYELPAPSPYDPSKDYYFTHDFSYSSNSLVFGLVEKSTLNSFNIFKVTNPTYKIENKKFSCSVYFYADGTTNTFTFN
ncbi:MAG: hypothetical protein MJ199_01530, partial [Bacilli bacterium]|nr:hypothetical protein [Bacilli bacterium]